MTLFQGILLIIFFVFAFVGYKIISKVPSLLHTPLMSGMNAFSGVTVLGCLSATALAVATSSKILGCIAIILAMINVVGGFGVTDRMLRMFHKKDSGKKEDK
ncbi:MAG: NAD(P) transhydrogenase subunit alpha [Clostridia bacterium]|nr:NAD(P) transhydrogenase subunit alpha [Clostridia bacterium]